MRFTDPDGKPTPTVDLDAPPPEPEPDPAPDAAATSPAKAPTQTASTFAVVNTALHRPRLHATPPPPSQPPSPVPAPAAHPAAPAPWVVVGKKKASSGVRNALALSAAFFVISAAALIFVLTRGNDTSASGPSPAPTKSTLSSGSAGSHVSRPLFNEGGSVGRSPSPTPAPMLPQNWYAQPPAPAGDAEPAARDRSHGRDDARLGETRSLLDEAESLRRSMGNRNWSGVSALHRGDAALSHGEYAAAQAAYGQAWQIFDAAGNQAGMLLALRGAGRTALKLSDADRARKLLDQALELCWEGDDRIDGARVLESLAAVSLAVVQPERAAKLLGAAAALREQSGTVVLPDESDELNTRKAMVQQNLGEDRYKAAFDAGHAMDWEHAVQLAREPDRAR